MTYRILMLSSIALAAPWNGADKNLARLIAQSDSNNQFIVQTGIDEAWLPHVSAVRLPSTSPTPTNLEKLRGFSYLVRHTRDVDLVHVVASLRAERLALGPRAVLYPAHYGPQSGISEIIRAFAQLPATLDDATLVLACRPRSGQNPAREAQNAMALAAAAGIAHRVRVIGNVSDMPALILACAVTALLPGKLASKMDLPLVVLETLALERPVIISNKPPMSEALFGGGFAVRHGDVPALAAALGQLLSDSNLRRKLAAEGCAAVLQQCHPARVVDRYQEVYQSAFEGRQELARRLL